MTRLTTTNHSRDSAGLRYVYPVLSRRAGGLSIGINLNVNNACNWRCIYCQVPDLVRGKPEPIDLGLLRSELTELLDDALHGDFFERYEVADAQRIIRDIAISGNGEPTLSPDFAAVVNLIGEVARERTLPATVGRTLITNGSGLGKATIQTGLAAWSEQGGEIWFKLDRATAASIWQINQVHLDPETHLHQLKIACQHCPTSLQTCLFTIKGQHQDEVMEIQAYLDVLTDIKRRDIPLRGITLYGLARPSMQPESELLIPWPQTRFDELAERIRQLGFEVKVSV